MVQREREGESFSVFQGGEREGDYRGYDGSNVGTATMSAWLVEPSVVEVKGGTTLYTPLGRGAG